MWPAPCGILVVLLINNNYIGHKPLDYLALQCFYGHRIINLPPKTGVPDEFSFLVPLGKVTADP